MCQASRISRDLEVLTSAILRRLSRRAKNMLIGGKLIGGKLIGGRLIGGRLIGGRLLGKQKDL
jgi:hypothetical protein